ncbi:DUF5710 domain-containing protein [Chitinophaga vietnamensis]|uniref:DUF5710 domain-containing protein n=1 Tax=Chitinophaga vietnamensis TaxID=2593957 RepID=UPI001177661D|nr:DUF5710 domain-containing protein [Chitinophaga vietnamensis]
MALLLNVPDADKSAALAEGARWEAASKTWYLPTENYGKLKEVERWMIHDGTDIILSNELLVAHTNSACHKCGHINRVIAIGSDTFYERDMNERDEAVWLEQDFFTLFQQITQVSGNLKSLLHEHYPRYQPAWSKTANTHLWCNHCEQCKSKQGDWCLFDKPGSPFHPEQQEEAANILIKIYPLKFAPLVNAGYGFGPHLRLISEFAVRG